MAVVLTLGSFTFADLEIPSKIPFGGEQRTITKKLIGGARVVETLGPDPIPLAWSGYLLGPEALARAKQLNALKDAGLPLDLSWSQLKYSVVISSFVADFMREFDIPYHIVCEVVQDESQAASTQGAPDVNGAINADATTASSLVAQIANPNLTSLMGSLTNAIGSVPNFASLSSSAIAGVVNPLTAVQSACGGLIASNESILGSVPSLGGLVPGALVSANVSALASQVTACVQQPTLLNLSSVLGRIGSNLGSVNASANLITVPGGNLFDLAAKSYGDATAWTTIAQANPSLAGDPQLSGIVTLAIPQLKRATGGVLGV